MNKISNFQFSLSHNPRRRRGFTLIETFVAITVLLVSLAGPLSIAAQALKSAYYARDQITAFYLAQEGLEFVRVYRDQNYLGGQPGFVNFSAFTNNAYQVDFPNFTAGPCPSQGCLPLLIDPTSHLFNTKTGNPSIFTRTITLIAVAGRPDEIIVQAKVSWMSAGISRSFQLSEHLFNWL